MSNAPSLRVKGRTLDWSHEALSELVAFSKGKGYSRNDISDAGVPLMLYGRMYTDYQFEIDNVDTFTIPVPNSKISTGSEVVIPASGESAEDISRAAAILTPGIILGGDLNILTPDERINPSFLALSISNGQSQKELSSKAQGKTVVHLHNSDIQELTINYPDKEEQQQIKYYFTIIDRLITLHQRKLDNLLSVRKSMLQKMFPRNGSKTPEIRFKGFIGDWDEQYLYDYLTVSTELNADNKYDREEVLSVSGEYGIVNQIELLGRSFAGVSIANYSVVHTGDVVYTKSPLSSNPFGIIKTNKGPSGIVSTLYAVYHVRNNAYPDFIQSYFDLDERMNRYMQPLVNKGAKNDMKVTSENALKGKVIFPSYQEQVAIANFFATLETLIQKYRQRIQRYQMIKKSLLAKMLV